MIGQLLLEARPGISILRADYSEINEMFLQNHYLHRKRVGVGIGYWVTLDQEVVGGVLYSDVPTPLPNYLDWLELSRYWLHPTVQGKTLTDSKGRTHTLPVASKSIALSLKQLRKDYHRELPHRTPLMGVISWSDDTLFTGTIYKACNFVLDEANAAGVTSGIRKGIPKPIHDDYSNPKKRWRYTYRK